MESNDKLHSKTRVEVNNSELNSEDTHEIIADLTEETQESDEVTVSDEEIADEELNEESNEIDEPVTVEPVETIESTEETESELTEAEVEAAHEIEALETVEVVESSEVNEIEEPVELIETVVTTDEISDEAPVETVEEIESAEEIINEEPVENIEPVEAIEEIVTEESVQEVDNIETTEEVEPEVLADEQQIAEVSLQAEEPVVSVSDDIITGDETSDDILLSVGDEEFGDEEFGDEEIHSDILIIDSEIISSKFPDYSNYSEVELINELRNLLEDKGFNEIYGQIESIKICFYKKHKLKLQEEKKKFIEEGGFEEEFKPESDPYEQDLKALLQQYKQKKFEHIKDIESEKEENIKKKIEIIDEIKNLVNRKESINKTFQEFRELQQKWHEIGLVPQANMKDLWETYHHHVENFYDYIKINKELRDLDLKKNLEEKIGLCEKAESLLLEPSIIKAFNTLQKYHDLWREIGPVPRDNKEDLWERFKAVTTSINKKHQEFFESRKKTQKKNLDAKTALCEKVEEILENDLATHKDWEDKSKDLVELQKYWRTIGFAPKKENSLIYDRFRKACDAFFDKKREFYSQHKEVQGNNLQLKIDLCIQAEALKESTDWKKATDEFINIQKKWKEIGPVPRKQSDIIWKRFRAACDFFFKHKTDFFSSKDSEQAENLRIKNELIEAVTTFESTGSDEKDFENLRDFQRRWTEIGHVPIQEKDVIQKRFREAINKQFDKIRVEDKDRNLAKFKNKMTDWKTSSKGNNKMFAERDKYVIKLRQIESDLVTLKNNIGFFANSKNAEALIKDVEKKIQNNEEQIIYLKNKIKVIDDVDYTEE
jgi:hypothetical protein